MLRFLIIALVSCSTVSAKSIFDDDDFPPQKPSTSTPTPTKRSPKHPAPDPVTVPEPTGVPPVPPEPKSVPEQKNPSEDHPESKTTAAPIRIPEPVDLADQMETAAQRAINGDPECVKRIQATIQAKAAWEASKRNSDAEDKAKAFVAYNDAVAAEKSAKEQALAGNKTYLDIKRRFDKLPKIPVVTMDRPKEFADAIARHDLIEGMTLKEAKQSARVPSQLVFDNGNQKTYRWIIKGRLRTYTVAHMNRFGHTSYEPASDYGVLGYVEATFVDDELATFRRVADRSAR